MKINNANSMLKQCSSIKVAYAPYPSPTPYPSPYPKTFASKKQCYYNILEGII